MSPGAPTPRPSAQSCWRAKVIVEGGGAVGKSLLMPASPALKDKPEVMAELVTLIRSFAALP